MAKQATINTNQGTIKVKLFDAECPGTVGNFEKLSGEGYYDGTKFHRVISDFMIQGGDPYSKNGKGPVGTGGPGYNIDCELNPKLKHSAGTLSMAHAGGCQHDKKTGAKLGGRCSNGSQFFITHQPTPHLDLVHTVFGQVTQGQDVVNAIRQGDEIKSIQIEAV